VWGQFFRALSITLSVSVLLSLALALFLIPLLARWAYRGGRPHHGRGARLDAAYARALESVSARPRLLAAVVAGLALLAVLLFLRMPSGFLPEMDEGGFVIDYNSPPGTALEETDVSVRRIEALLKQTPDVASFSRRTGSELGLFATQQTKGDIVVRLKPRRQRRRADDVVEDLRAKIKDEVKTLKSVEFVLLLQDMIGDLEGNPEPIEVKLFGDDQQVLSRLAGEVEPRMRQVKGLVDVVSVQKGNPEVTWTIDAAAAGRLGLTVSSVSDQLQAAGLGEVATELRLSDRTIPVRVRYPDAVRLDPARLAQAAIRSGDKVVPFSALARPQAAAPEDILLRENLRQMALLTGRLEERDLGGAVSELRQKLSDLKLPPGYTLEIGGQLDSQRQAFRELLTVLGIAASLVLVILVVEFRAFTPALLILCAAPLSFGGALLMLITTGTELNVSSAMGFILLVGLVVKNGIVMIDYAHHLRARGQGFEEALKQAAHVRLRPILMTTLCTLFGLLPLALGLGAGAELQKPLALVVVGGLALSTVVTLFAVPTFYMALRRRRAQTA